ncbi:hypothetical protein RF11_10840 [Thelohanellus kitauei]|uniref:Reverse transcriptase domain-containing protein n=1 Tax=Thelohanellus kitauei TaxID=669202 RepID=A0A0C2MAB4_THEKT|nr:hypothetical protein RF11_10840 [Thelohanellus kitauei]
MYTVIYITRPLSCVIFVENLYYRSFNGQSRALRIAVNVIIRLKKSIFEPSNHSKLETDAKKTAALNWTGQTTFWTENPLITSSLDEGVKNGVWVSCQLNEYGSPIVPIRKYGSGKLRICGDYSAFVNKYLDEHRYPIPSIDELLRQLNGYHYFTKVDLANAYNQIRLSPDSQKRLAISTHRGVFLQARLPFGIKSAPGYFQEIMSKVTAGLQGVAVYLDDILVTGSDDSSHLKNLDNLLRRLDECGFKCNMDKCEFAQSEFREYLRAQSVMRFWKCLDPMIDIHYVRFWGQFSFITNS